MEFVEIGNWYDFWCIVGVKEGRVRVDMYNVSMCVVLVCIF